MRKMLSLALSVTVLLACKATAARAADTTAVMPDSADVMYILNHVDQTWQRRHSSHGNYEWNRAVYHVGNMAAWRVTGDSSYLDYSTAWSEHNNWAGAAGNDTTAWKYTYGTSDDYVLFGDNQICFQTYIDLFNADHAHDSLKIRRALGVMDYQTSTEANDYLWWIDGTFMVMPVMTKLYNLTGQEKYLEKMHAYWLYANSIMYDDSTGLYFRDARYVYPQHQTYSGKRDFWARGNGWMFAAFARILDEMSDDAPYREEYINYYRRMAEALKECQQDEGYWTRSLLDPDYAPGRETSGTALFAYGLAWGIRHGVLAEADYLQTLLRAWHYLANTAYQTDGTVGYIQPIGDRADPNQTLSASNYYDFGVGAFLLAASEMSQLANSSGVVKLRINDVTIDSANQLTVTFNVKPDSAEATSPATYQINGRQVEAASISLDGCSVVISLAEPMDYGRYTLSIADIHSADGGSLTGVQEFNLVRTVALDGSQEGVTISAIGSQWGNPHWNVNDNSLSTRWSQEGDEQWICYDLGDEKSVWAVDVAFYSGNQRQSYFKVQTSTDNTEWTDATGDLTSSGLTEEMERYSFTPVNARYVRLLCSGNSENRWCSITELRVRYDEATGIKAVTTDRDSNRWYDLQGRPAGSPQGNGIYIRNGKKTIINKLISNK